VRILITGAGGQVGRDLSLVLAGEMPPAGAATALMGQPPVADGEFDVHGLDRAALDVTDRSAVLDCVSSLAPDVVVHLAAYTAVDRAEDDPEGARAVNEEGTANVAEAAEGAGAHLIYVSTDYVFPGDLGRALVESDPTGPRSVYGATKLAGEARCAPSASILRTSWVAGVWNRTVITLAVESAAAARPLRFVDDQVGSPTASADLAAGIVAFIRERPAGIFHVAGSGAASWFDVIAYAFGEAGGDRGLVSAIATEDLDPPQRATRPRYSALVSERLSEVAASPLPDWHEGIGRLVAAITSS
jgi:dTDP-4-dehydrorhamnose reductase